jgi:catechol 2,3-dioxygenase-like lactoylglutathione lyase family enzyme
MALDHVTVPVRSYEAAKRFYEHALAPLGFVVLLDWPDKRRAYLGLEGAPSSVWVVEAPDAAGGADFCLAAESPEAVDEFRFRALLAGGRKAGEGARVLDPDGNALEAVHRHLPVAAAA